MAQQGELEMWKMLLISVGCVGCVAANEGAAVQAVAGPGGVTVTARPDPSQLAVSWSTDAAATQYRVLRSSGGSAFAFVDSVSGAPPSTSYIDTGLSGGVSYCYAIQSVHTGGATSDPGAAACAVATGGGGASAGLTIDAPTMSAGNNNNWSPPGFSSASLIRVKTGSGFPFLTGLSGGVDGRTVTLVMTSVVDPLTITRLDGSSLPENQLLLPLPLPPGAVYLQMTAIDQAITLTYDGVASRWRIVSRNF